MHRILLQEPWPETLSKRGSVISGVLYPVWKPSQTSRRVDPAMSGCEGLAYDLHSKPWALAKDPSLGMLIYCTRCISCTKVGAHTSKKEEGKIGRPCFESVSLTLTANTKDYYICTRALLHPCQGTAAVRGLNQPVLGT